MKRFAALFLVAAVAACSDTTGPAAELADGYILTAHQGHTLPTPLNDGSDAPILIAASITIEDDGTFVLRRYYKDSLESAEIREDVPSTGTVLVRSNGEIWFNFSGFEYSAEAERSGDELLLMGGTWVEGVLGRSVAG